MNQIKTLKPFTIREDGAIVRVIFNLNKKAEK